MKYVIRITETLVRDLTIEATSADEAIEHVISHYDNCDIVLDYSDHRDTIIDIAE